MTYNVFVGTLNLTLLSLISDTQVLEYMLVTFRFANKC